MNTTPLAEQPKIVLYGLRNAGKSSLMNNLFEKDVSIISPQPGTTTDPVTRSMELGGLGPVSITDTAGCDDTGSVGQLRTGKSAERLRTADVILFVTPLHLPPAGPEIELLEGLEDKPLLCVLTHSDREADRDKLALLADHEKVLVNNLTGEGIAALKQSLVNLKTKIRSEITPLEGLVREQDLVILVTPIDLAAPKGRLILPQVETIRDLLDRDCATLIVKERELKYFYDSLTIKPRLVVTDSQAFSKVAADLPREQPLTSFSILFARKKGDLEFYLAGVRQLASIRGQDRILILESCSHHRQADDIGTVKIPRLFKQMVHPDVSFTFSRRLPDNIQDFSLVITCAGCMVSRNLIMERIRSLQAKGIPALNYGLFLAWANGLLPRAVEPLGLG